MLVQRLQPALGTPDHPVGHGGPAQLHTLSRPDLLLPGQRNSVHILLRHNICHSRGRCQRVLHKRRRRSGGNDMGKAGILLTLVAGIGAAVVFQNLLRLRDNDEFPADELLTNELKSAAALVTGKPGFRKVNYNFFYRKILCQLVNGSFLLPGMRFYGKGFLRRFLRLAVLTDLRLIEQAHLVFAQNIGLFLAGLAEAGSLCIGKDLIHVLQLPLQLRVFLLQCFYRLGQRADELRNFRGSICNFPVCCGHEFSSQKQL